MIAYLLTLAIVGRALVAAPCTPDETPIAALSWEQDNRAEVDGFRLYARVRGSSEWTMFQDFAVELHEREPGVRTRWFRGLDQPTPYLSAGSFDERTTYEFAVTSYNAAGESAFSNVVSDCVPVYWDIGSEARPGLEDPPPTISCQEPAYAFVERWEDPSTSSSRWVSSSKWTADDCLRPPLSGECSSSTIPSGASTSSWRRSYTFGNKSHNEVYVAVRVSPRFSSSSSGTSRIISPSASMGGWQTYLSVATEYRQLELACGGAGVRFGPTLVGDGSEVFDVLIRTRRDRDGSGPEAVLCSAQLREGSEWSIPVSPRSGSTGSYVADYTSSVQIGASATARHVVDNILVSYDTIPTCALDGGVEPP